MKRIPPSTELTKLAEALRADTQTTDLTGELIRIGAKKVIQELLEKEAEEFLGRGYYERRDENMHGYRNGYKERHLDSAEGRLMVDVPQVRGVDEPYSSVLWAHLKKRTETLENLVVEMYVRGLSTRDIEDALSDLADGEGSLLSRSSVSRITEVLWEEYEAFCERDLSSFEVVYLFADAVYESLRKQAGTKEGVLVTWAILADGAKVLIHMTTGNKESYDAWLEHFRSLVKRGLKVPLTVTSDGAPGLIKAIEAMWPEAERIRCWVHKMKNLLEKVPDDAKAIIKPYLEAVRDAADYGMGKIVANQVIDLFKRDYPSFVKCLAEDIEASLAHLKLPAAHRKNIRTTNLCERSFVEERRRSKVIPRFRGEKECLKLVFATLWRASERWNRVKFTEHERKALDRYIENKKNADQKEARVPATVA
jgi:transposase-like protein